ncbi:protein of unknown function [Chitinophaga sp. CF118]|uniref:DUF4267 domain-containing protein n=1 Tax=Chitinophaga sp. CF118 TaxID=1884367 RepID=UPI0008F034B8|nr:DUF4267 domain-containing protein [Chitinophaga sp. CF118]SFD88328.1 protein of unknown function [Chitinophaga sp. CF118]
MQTSTNQQWGTRSISFWMVAVIALGISFIGIRYMFLPHPASTGFGIPLSYDHAELYGVIKGIRDLFSGLVLSYLLWIRNRQITLVVFSLAILIPIIDGVTIYLANGSSDIVHLSVHWGTALYGIITSILLFVRK